MTELERFRAFLIATPAARAQVEVFIQQDPDQAVDQVAALAHANGFEVTVDELEAIIAQAATDALRNPSYGEESAWTPSPELIVASTVAAGKGASGTSIGEWVMRWLRGMTKKREP